MRIGFLEAAVCAALATVAIAACSSSSDDGQQATCPPDNKDCAALATVQAGQQSVQQRHCVDCHTANMAGSAKAIVVQNAAPDVELYAPNLTNDKDTGVGTWTDDQLANAIRVGIDNTSEQLCPQMKHFSSMSDFEVYSIVKYLRSLPPVNQKIPRSVCPPFKTKDQQ